MIDHIGINASDHEKSKAFNYCGAFVRDPDGHKPRPSATTPPRAC